MRVLPGTPSPHSGRKALDYVLVALSPSPSPPSPFLVLPPGGAPPDSPLPPLPTSKSLCSLLELSDHPAGVPPPPAHPQPRESGCDKSHQLRFNKTHFPRSVLALGPLGREHRGSRPSAAPRKGPVCCGVTARSKRQVQAMDGQGLKSSSGVQTSQDGGSPKQCSQKTSLLSKPRLRQGQLLQQKPRPGVSSARAGKTGNRLTTAVTGQSGRVGDLCRSQGTELGVRGEGILINSRNDSLSERRFSEFAFG